MAISSGLGRRFARWGFGVGRRCVDRGTDTRVGAATADVGHRLVDILVRRLGLFLEQRSGRHHLTRLAIAALRNLVLDPGFLHRVHPAARREPLDRHHLLVAHCGHRIGTRAHRLAIEMHGTGATKSFSATELRSLQLKNIKLH